MRSGNAVRHARILKVFERNAIDACEAGLSRVRIQDADLIGDSVTVDGNRLVNFGLCSYLGLSLDPRLKQGAIDAIERYGTVYSSSSGYSSLGLFTELEDRLEQILGMPVLVPTTTTLGHLSFLPTIIGPDDAVVIDAQAHSSLHLGTQPLIAEGIPVVAVGHNDMEELDSTLERLTPAHEAVWYIADGVYSMYGDVVPVEIRDRLDRFDNMWAYIDDAHGFGWGGLHGRGVALDRIGPHPRMVVAVSLAKSFASGGAAIAFPTREMARRVQLCGGTMTFSGPLGPPELGAAVVAADIHLSDEHQLLQRRLVHQMELIQSTAVDLELPLMDLDLTPIWFARIGRHDHAVEVGKRMIRAGYFLNISSFPIVPPGQSGLRFTNTLYLNSDQITSMLERLAQNIRDVVGETELVVDLTAEATVASGSEAFGMAGA